MTAVMMAAGFAVLTGIALIFTLEKAGMRIGEGMFLAVSTVILVMALAGAARCFRAGTIVLILLSVFGFAAVIVRRGLRGLSVLADPVFLVLAAVVLYGCTAFHGAVLLHIDEYHMWGAAVRYMEENGRLVDFSALGSGRQLYACSLFQLFFVQLTGYSVQAMYASALLMVFTGLMLPVSRCGRKGAKSVLLWFLILFVSLYSLSLYPYMTLYTDIPCAAWAGGLAGWLRCRGRGRRRQNVFFLTAGLLTLIFLKSYVGILMAGLVLLYLCVQKGMESGRLSLRRERRKALFVSALILPALCAAAGGFMAAVCTGHVPAILRGLTASSGASMEKLTSALGALGSAFLGRTLSTASGLHICTASFLLFLLCALIIRGWLLHREEETGVFTAFFLAAAVIYLMFLAVSFVCLFSYAEGADAVGARRYFSILVLFLLLITMSLWMDGAADASAARGTRRLFHAGALALLLFFSAGINDRYAASASALNLSLVEGGSDIQRMQEELPVVRETAGEEKIFFVNQSDENEFPQNIAFYELQGQVSNYQFEPWRFTEGGSMIRKAEVSSPSLADLPALLAQGGYGYMWVYASDSYLQRHLGEVLPVSGESSSSSGSALYRVVYEDGRAAGLEIAASF